MKKVLIYGLYDWNNLGDDLMMHTINNVLLKNNIQPYFITGHNDNYFEAEYLYEEKLKTDKICNNKILNAVLKFWQVSTFNPKKENYDSIIFMGGGYINRNIGSGYGKLIYIYLLKRKFKRKKVFFTGQTTGPINNNLDKYIIKKIYKESNVYVREKFSNELLNSLNIKNTMSGDDAFLLDVSSVTTKKKSNYFIVNFKSFFGYEKLFDNFYELILNVAKSKKMNVILIPFRNNSKYDEFNLHLKLRDKLKRDKINVTVFESRNINELINCISNSEFMIGTAYHFVTLGILLNKPIFTGYIGEYYKMKIEGVIKINDYKSIKCYDLSMANFDKIYNDINTFNFNLEDEKVSKVVKEVGNEWNRIIEKINGDVE